MNIGIIGSGQVGQKLAGDLVKLGHSVTVGTRDPQKLSELVAQNPGVKVGSNTDAATFGEIVLLATGWSGTQNALELTGARHLAGKVVVDITNPLDFSSGKPALALGWNTSAGEQVQSWLPESHVVKALNIVTANAMLNPTGFIGHEPDMFIAGNDADAKKTVAAWLEGVGWGIVDLGDITQSRLIEPLAMIWIQYGFNSGWKIANHGFKLINK
jgi:8-hydroxy-5-deazaflavin:NADPH oxidoreductase